MPVTELSPAAGAYLLFLAFVCGACAGSFVNCAALRKARGERFTRGRSHCPKCGHTLGVRDLFPLVSWLALRGQCRFCGARIPGRYPVTELTGALAFTAALLRFGLSAETVQVCLLFALLLALALIDLDTMELPDGLLIAGAVLWAAFLPFRDAPLQSLLQGLAGGLALGGALLVLTLIMDRVLKRDSMGGGDIKLLAMLGLYSGPAVGLLLVLLACIAGLAFARLRSAGDRPFPFGPAIAAAAVPALLLGPQIVSWYLGLFI